MLSGLCGGLSELTNVDATLFRILLVVLTIFSSGTLILVYIIVSMIVPKGPDIHNPFGHYRNPNQGPYGYQDPMNAQRNHYDSTNQHASHNPNWNTHQSTGQAPYGSPSQQPTEPTMDDLEKKALRREIEELKSKLSKVEKGE